MSTTISPTDKIIRGVLKDDPALCDWTDIYHWWPAIAHRIAFGTTSSPLKKCQCELVVRGAVRSAEVSVRKRQLPHDVILRAVKDYRPQFVRPHRSALAAAMRRAGSLGESALFGAAGNSRDPRVAAERLRSAPSATV